MGNNLYKKLKIAVLLHFNPQRAPVRYYKNARSSLNYVNLCINSIKDSNLNKKKPSEDHLYQEKSKTLFHSIDDYKNDIINIKSLISYDLIHYGLKAGETH